MTNKTVYAKSSKTRISRVSLPPSLTLSAVPMSSRTVVVKSSFAQELPEFDDHRLLTFLHDPLTGLRSFVAIHRGGILAPAFGATRFLHYENESAAARDALRLARTMSYKSAIAGLPYGGAKGVIMAPVRTLSSLKKMAILRQYATHLNYFRGAFITGTDVGINKKELDAMHRNTRHLVGFRVSPEEYTAIGVVRSIESTLEALFRSSRIRGRSFAVQGLGKVGFRVASRLADAGAILYISDIDDSVVSDFKKRYPNATVVFPKEIHAMAVDVFVPCALYGVLNEKTIPQLQCGAIVGAANNQLSDLSVVSLLTKRGILYIPDYVVNAGGLISVAEEYGHEQMSPTALHRLILEKVHAIGDTVHHIIAQAKRNKKTPLAVSNSIAESIFNKIV